MLKILPSIKPPKDSASLKKHPFLHYIRLHKKNFAIGLACLLFTNLLDALPPLLIGKAIDQISSGSSQDSILKTLGLLLSVTLGLSVFRFAWRIFWSRFSHSVAEDLRNRIFDRYTELGPSFYSKNSVGELMSLINNDVNSFRMAIGPGLLILVDALFIMCIVPPLMITISPEWTWKTLILVPILPFIMKRLMNAIRGSFRVQQEKFAELSGVSQEIVSGIRVIKSYAQELNQTRLFNYRSKNFELACNDVAKYDSLFTPISDVAVSAGAVILLSIGAPEVMSGAVSVGSFFAFYQYIQRMVWPMEGLGMCANFIQKGRASFERIMDLLEQTHEVPDTGTLPISRFESLEVSNLTFTYPGDTKPTLKSVSFEFKRGETLGIVGSIGAGKSTLIELFCRQYPVTPGSIVINDQPIERYKKQDLMQLFSLVPQDAFLFSRKVSENIAFGLEDWNESEIRKVAKLVNIHQEILNIPEGYDAYLGEKGVNLSGGQKQRLTLARALVRNSDVLVLDDSLSAVDAKTETKILNSLKGEILKEGEGEEKQTTIIISHRLASLRWADRIVVLKNGTVEAFDHHDSLLETSPTYKNIHRLQTES